MGQCCLRPLYLWLWAIWSLQTLLLLVFLLKYQSFPHVYDYLHSEIIFFIVKHYKHLYFFNAISIHNQFSASLLENKLFSLRKKTLVLVYAGKLGNPFESCVFFLMYLFLYRLFMEILNSCVDCDEIQFKEDCNWAPMRYKKVVQEVSASSNGIEGNTTKTVIFFELWRQ